MILRKTIARAVLVTGGLALVASTAKASQGPCNVVMHQLSELQVLVVGEANRTGKPPSTQRFKEMGEKADLLKDPWGRDYIYDTRVTPPLLFSAGANGIQNDRDDIGMNPFTRECPYSDVVIIEADGKRRIVPIEGERGVKPARARSSKTRDFLALAICLGVVLFSVAFALVSSRDAA